MNRDKEVLMEDILKFCEEAHTAKEIAEEFDMNQNTIRSHYIYAMVKLGILKKNGKKSYIKAN